jgi:hypothetical protein
MLSGAYNERALQEEDSQCSFNTASFTGSRPNQNQTSRARKSTAQRKNKISQKKDAIQILHAQSMEKDLSNLYR